MTVLELARAFRDAVLNITNKDGQPATLGTAGGTVFYNDGTNDHLDRVWVRMGADQQVLVIAKVGKRGLPNVPGLEVNVTKRHGSLYVDDWQTVSGIGASGTTGIGVSGHSHDYATRNVKVSEYAGTPTGSDNVVMGHTAGSGMGASSDQNVIIGSSAAASADADVDSVVIGYAAGDYTASPAAISSYDAATDITVAGEDIVTQAPQGGTTPQRNALLTTDRVVTVYGATSGTANEKGYARIIETGTPTVYSASKFTQIDNDFGQANVCALSVNRFLVAFTEFDNVTDSVFELWLIAGQESAGTISWGSAVQVENFTQGEDFHIDAISSSYAVLTVSDSTGTYTYSNIITISALAVTIGADYDYQTTNNVISAASFALSTTKILTVWNQYNPGGAGTRQIESRIGNVSGTTITYATTTHTVATDSADIPQFLRGASLSSTAAILSYQRTAGDNQGYVIVCAVNGDDTITWGTPVEFYATCFNYQSLDTFSSTKAIITYMDGAAWGFRSKVITISGTVPSIGAATTFTPDDDDTHPHVIALDSTRFFVSYDTDDAIDTYIRFTIGNLAASTRSNNVFVGSGAGGGSGVSYGVAIGYQAGANETVNYRLYIDISNTATPLIYGEFDNDNLGINGTDMAGGSGVIFIANASTVPTGTPTGGGVLYVEAGALKYKGSGGLVTTIAEASA